MGRKRKAGSIPAPLRPTLLAAALSAGSKKRAGKTRPIESRKNGASSKAPKGKRRRELMAANPGATPLPDKRTPTAPTGSSGPPFDPSTTSGASAPLLGARKALSSPPRPPPSKHVSPVENPAGTAPVPREAVGAPVARQGTTPSDVTGDLLRASGWTLGSCWGQGCGCSGYKRAPPPPSRPSPIESDHTTQAAAAAAAATTPGFTVCACGHRSCAHELVDSDACSEGMHDREQQRQPQQQYRYYLGEGAGAGAAAAAEVAVRLRRLFSAIRNARAVGDCGLFEDSQGVGGWGAGWFLSRLARRYLNQARQAMAELGGALHDPPAVARCLAAAEALMSGSATGQWTMPDSLPASCTYQALGTGVASELDLAYWHVRYTAASRFDAGTVTAETTSWSSHVVPPPEVYFVGLAFHVPSVAELAALPQLGSNPALRRMLAQVFDLPVGAAAGDPDCRSKGLSDTSNGGTTRVSTGHENASSKSKNDNDDEDTGDIRFPVLTNPLLAVVQSSWLETAVSAGAGRWVPHFPPRFGDSEGTMRGSDPALPPPIRVRCDATRDWSARLLAFAVPNRRALEACRRALAEACRSGGGGGRQGRPEKNATEGGIVEVGAGLGYWKWVLERDGAFSGCSSSSGSGGGNWDRCLSHGGLGNEMLGGVGGGGGDRNGGRGSKGAPPLNFLAIDKDPSRLPGPCESINAGIANEFEQTRGGPARGKNRGGPKGGRRGKGQQRNGARPGGSVAPTHNEYHGGAPAWAAVEKGGPERLRALSATRYPVLLLCYPPPSVGGGSGGLAAGANGCMGADALEKFSGKVLLYVGEVGGDTGSPRLEAALRAGWDLVEEVDLPCFPSTANRLMVFNRKGDPNVAMPPARRSLLPSREGGARTASASAVKGTHGTDATAARPGMPAGRATPSGASWSAQGEPSGDVGGWGPAMPMYRCSGCGAAAAAGSGGGERGVRLHRCRLTRAVSYCSEKCLALDGGNWRANLDARHVHLAAGGAVRVAQQCGQYGGVFRDKKLFKRLTPPALG
ncbi:unnamed protein product [Scytosiphon promiscuus]